MLVKILGTIDFLAGIAFLFLIFGVPPWTPFFLFCGGLLFVKGMFVLTGDFLSALDLFAGFLLVISLFFSVPAIFVWFFALFLIAKATASFV